MHLVSQFFSGSSCGDRRALTRASAAGRVMGLLVDFDQVFGLDEVESFWTLLFERKKEKKRNEAKREESLSKQTGWSSSEVVKTAKRPLKGYEDLSTMNGGSEERSELDFYSQWSLHETLQRRPWAMSATSHITAEILRWQAGIRIPYVPCLSLYIPVRYQPAKPQILFFRSSLPQQAPFQRVLRLLEAERGEGTPEERGDRSSRIVFMGFQSSMSFHEIASFEAVAMLPHIPNALRLSDMYSMAIPLFVPDEPLIHKFLWPDDPMPLLSKIRAAEMTEEETASPLSTASPLDFQVAGRHFYKHMRDRHHWLQYTEWWLRPHLLRFSNLDQTHQHVASQQVSD